MSEDTARWLDGTQMLGVLLLRFANGRPVTVTKADVEAAKFNTTHPVVFTIHEGGERCDLHVALPGEKFSIGGTPDGETAH
jgi:hypothetical protein